MLCVGSRMQCVVKGCNSLVGVPFPLEKQRREEWLTSLQLRVDHIQPKSIVCLNHFDSQDILVVFNSDGKATKMIKKGAVPKSGLNDTRKINFDEFGSMCRLCLTSLDLVSRIEDTIKENISIAIAIKLCCSLQIQPNDGLPQHVCATCLDELKTAHNMRVRCLETNAKLEMGNSAAIQRKRQNVEQNVNVIDMKRSKSFQERGENLQGKKPEASNYQSTLGVKECQIRIASQGFFFIEAEEYLYYFGLLRRNTRTLQCITKNCPALADHKRIDDDSYEDEIQVKEPHNHRPLSKMDQKVEIFYYIMRKKMQHDKNLNVRNAYEQLCDEDEDLRRILPLRSVFNELCKVEQQPVAVIQFKDFASFYRQIESEDNERLHFTQSGKQFYQQRLRADDGAMAVIFCNTELLEKLDKASLMYVDGSFRVDASTTFPFQMITVLLWIDDSYYPVMFALVSEKTQLILREVFAYLHDVLAPNLRPKEIVTEYSTSLYYALAEVYLESAIGGSVFYYMQSVYRSICRFGLATEIESNPPFRNIYHLILMLPLLPVNTIQDAMINIEQQAVDHNISTLCEPLFNYVKIQWLQSVTPDLFCVHRLDNRINENVMAPFKKFRDMLLWFKGSNKSVVAIHIHQIITKLIDLEAFLLDVYARQDRKSFGRDLSTSQKKNVIKAWTFIEMHPTININNFLTRVGGYVKCMENQLWIWGYYKFKGNIDEEELICASNLLPSEEEIMGISQEESNQEDLQEEDQEQQQQQDQELPPEGTVYYEQHNEDGTVQYVMHSEQNGEHEPDDEDEEQPQQHEEQIQCTVDSEIIVAAPTSATSSSSQVTVSSSDGQQLLVMDGVIGQDGQVMLQDAVADATNWQYY